MKSFAVSLLLVILMLGVIVWNHIYINEVIDGLQAQLEALPAPTDAACADAARQLCEDWKAHMDIMELSVGFNIVDRVNEQAQALKACAECGDVFGYYTARALLQDAIEDVKRYD